MLSFVWLPFRCRLALLVVFDTCVLVLIIWLVWLVCLVDCLLFAWFFVCLL